MTVCIAALSELDQIVTATDMKLTKGHYSSEGASYKMSYMIGGWEALLAGQIEQIKGWEPLMYRLIGNNFTPKVDEMATFCRKAYEEFARQLAAEKVLSRLNLNIPEFLKSREDLGDAEFSRLLREVMATEVGFDLLVFGPGNDAADSAHIFIVSNPNSENPSYITYCDEQGFGVIGSGAFMAESTLHALNQSRHCNLATTLYNVACAKFAAESATDVGLKHTYITIHDTETGTSTNPDPAWLRGVKREWQRYGRPIMRQEAKVAASKEGERIWAVFEAK